MNDLEFVKICHGRHDLRKLNVPDEQGLWRSNDRAHQLQPVCRNIGLCVLRYIAVGHPLGEDAEVTWLGSDGNPEQG